MLKLGSTFKMGMCLHEAPSVVTVVEVPPVEKIRRIYIINRPERSLIGPYGLDIYKPGGSHNGLYCLVSNPDVFECWGQIYAEVYPYTHRLVYLVGRYDTPNEFQRPLYTFLRIANKGKLYAKAKLLQDSRRLPRLR